MAEVLSAVDTSPAKRRSSRTPCAGPTAEGFVARGSAQPLKLLTRAALREIVPYTPQHILRLEKKGHFPRRLQIGPNRVAWLLTEVEAWIAARVAERDSRLR